MSSECQGRHLGFMRRSKLRYLCYMVGIAQWQEFYIEITSAVTSNPEINAFVGEKKEATVVPVMTQLECRAWCRLGIFVTKE